MNEPSHPAFSSTPDMQISSANRDAMAPELEQIDRKVGWLIINRFTYKLMRVLGRLGQPKVDTSGVTITQVDGTGPGTYVVLPDERAGSGAVLLIHGGGLVIGSTADVRPQAVNLCRRLGVPVICSGYRLAPESPFPAGLDDCHSAWQWLLDHAGEMAIDTAKIVIGGYSAGAGLAACLAQKLRDEGGRQPAAQLLVYPMLDDRTAARRELDKPRHRVWSNRNNLFGWSSYLGHQPGQDSAQYAVAARQDDLSGLPPAWIGIGTCDLFLDEGRIYAQRLTEAGVATEYVEAKGALHAFDMGGTEMGKTFVNMQLEFVQKFVS